RTNHAISSRVSSWPSRLRAITSTAVGNLVLPEGQVSGLQVRVDHPGARVEQDDSLVGAEPTLLPQLPGADDGRGALRGHPQALASADELRRLADLLVRHCDRRAAARTERVQHEVIADRDRHAQAAGDRVGILPELGRALTALVGSDDGRAASRLD